LDVIGHIREEMQKVLNDYQVRKAREKAIQDEIGRKRAANPTFDYEDSPSLHSTGVKHRDPFHYIPPPIDSENTINPPKSKRRNSIQSYFTPPLRLKVKGGIASKAISNLPPLLALTMPMLLKFNPLNIGPP
jgi:hypothetical protein